MTSALNKYVFSCLPASQKHEKSAAAQNPRGTAAQSKPHDANNPKNNKEHNDSVKKSSKGHEGKPESTPNLEFKDKVHNCTPGDKPEFKDIKLVANTQVKLIEKHEQDIKDKPPNEQISGFDIPDNDALYEKINTYEFPMERYYLNAKDARRRETLANTCRLSNQKITSALNGLIRGRV